MAAPTRTPRSRWIEEGLRALAAGGPDAVRIEALAKSLGVTRGGFYWHFEDRGALLAELLDTWERAATDEVIDRVERQGGDARTRLRRAGALTFSADLLPVNLAVRAWSRHDPAWPGASAASITGGWSTCASSSELSAPARPRSRPGPCSLSRC